MEGFFDISQTQRQDNYPSNLVLNKVLQISPKKQHHLMEVYMQRSAISKTPIHHASTPMLNKRIPTHPKTNVLPSRQEATR